jgi:DNA-binding transcriptional LysR family regulator
MDLRRILHFNVFAETLNFSRAAERLYIAKPAKSMPRQKLETEHGTRLFERTPICVMLTSSGRAAPLEARRRLHHGEQLMRSTRDATAGTGGRLRIGFVGSAIHRIVPTLIPGFCSQYPGVELVLTGSTPMRYAAFLRCAAHQPCFYCIVLR